MQWLLQRLYSFGKAQLTFLCFHMPPQAQISRDNYYLALVSKVSVEFILPTEKLVSGKITAKAGEEYVYIQRNAMGPVTE